MVLNASIKPCAIFPLEQYNIGVVPAPTVRNEIENIKTNENCSD